jgi:hypothetical protein
MPRSAPATYCYLASPAHLKTVAIAFSALTLSGVALLIAGHSLAEAIHRMVRLLQEVHDRRLSVDWIRRRVSVDLARVPS